MSSQAATFKARRGARDFAEEDRKIVMELLPKRNSGTDLDLASQTMERRGSNTSSKASSDSTGGSSMLNTWADPSKPCSWAVNGTLRLYDQPRVNWTGISSANLMEAATLVKSLPASGRPTNFGVVAHGVYRSGYPQKEDYDFIQRIGVKTVVTLVNKEFPVGYKEFLAANGIQHHVFDMKGTKKEDIPEATMKGILDVVIRKKHHPMLIHCNHGKHRTGCVVGVVRKVMGWELDRILDEYRSFASPKERECDVTYITNFEIASLSRSFIRNPWVSCRDLKGWTCFATVTMLAVIICLHCAAVFGTAGRDGEV